jgi:hypothetical protein
MRVGVVIVTAVGIAAGGAAARGDERAWDASVGASGTHYDEFEDWSPGITVSLSRRLAPWLGADAQLGFSPSDLGDAGFSASRVEGFLGLSGGPRFGRHQAYAAVRPGFVRFAEAPEPIACIAIYPPPLVCAIAGGDTVFGLQLGAGAQINPSPRSVVRVEAATLLLRYPGPASTRDRSTLDDALWIHNLRLALSVGLRF